ncbi:MAG: PilZ domain-containing protein [Candidatus Omnitrophica bacterium]|nr:PilZ domain-containing protein [Candidatus Omnitrophota bacterium]
MYSGQDRRAFLRIKSELTVRYMAEGSKGEFCTTTRDISGSGLRIVLLEELSPGTFLDLEIFEKDSNTGIRCKGQISWISSSEVADKGAGFFEAGIRFIDSDLLCVARLFKDLNMQDTGVPFRN